MALRLLIVDDSEDDAALTVRQLIRAGEDVQFSRVDTSATFQEALARADWDAVLCDHRMPQFSSTEALRLHRQAGRDVPFIIVSGTIGEEAAVEAMKLGASDYLLKGNLKRLSVTIQRAREEARVRGERHTAELALEKSEAYLRAILQGAPDGIVTFTPEGRIESVNPAVETMFGLGPAELEGHDIGQILRLDEPPALRPGTWELSGLRRDGTRFPASVAVSDMSPSSRPLRVALVRDITLQKRSEEQLRQLAQDNANLYEEARVAVQRRDEFLAVASHELRTPLTPIALKLQALQDFIVANPATPVDCPPVKNTLSVLRRQLRRMTRLVLELLDGANIPTHGIRLVEKPDDLASIAREVLAQFEEESSRAGCHLELCVSGQTDGLWDAQRLDQLLTNLVSNAIKYGAGRPVQVELKGEAARVRICVRDWGIGIDPQDMHRIFGKFERAVSERHYGGLGLGLFISQQIVRACGGHIEVSSAPDTGTAFQVELPRRASTL